MGIGTLPTEVEYLHPNIATQHARSAATLIEGTLSLDVMYITRVAVVRPLLESGITSLRDSIGDEVDERLNI